MNSSKSVSDLILLAKHTPNVSAPLWLTHCHPKNITISSGWWEGQHPTLLLNVLCLPDPLTLLLESKLPKKTKHWRTSSLNWLKLLSKELKTIEITVWFWSQKDWLNLSQKSTPSSKKSINYWPCKRVRNSVLLKPRTSSTKAWARIQRTYSTSCQNQSDNNFF